MVLYCPLETLEQQSADFTYQGNARCKYLYYPYRAVRKNASNGIQLEEMHKVYDNFNLQFMRWVD